MMKYKILTVFFLFCCVYFYAQENNIIQKIDVIYKKFDDSCQIQKNKILGNYKKIDKIKNPGSPILKKYHEDLDLYNRKVSIFQTKKLDDLKNLLKEIESKNAVIGRKFFFSPKDETVTDQKIKEYFDYIFGENFGMEIVKVDEQEFEKVIQNYKTETEDLRKKVGEYFPTELFDYTQIDDLRTSVHFFIDTDGKLKKVRAYGDNEEYNTLTCLVIYAIDKKFEKYIYEGKEVLIPFKLPVRMIFE